MQTKAKGSSGQRRVVGVSPWEQATQGREALEAIPEGTRTKADYTRAMDGYRAVYHEAPQSQYAAASVNAVAELLAEQGRSLQDAKSLKAAVGQYEFLRTQYPGSSLRVGALLAEAQIYQNDLHDAVVAKEKYALLVKQYPRSSQAEEARAGLASLEQGTGIREQGTGNSAQGSSGVSASAAEGVGKSEGVSSFAAMPVTRSVDASGAQARVGTSSSMVKAAPVAAGSDADATERRGTANPPVDETSDVAEQSISAGLTHVAKNAGVKRKGGLAQVAGIRHWSTPNYTRVAIDLGDDVTYEAARVPHPDRIYFDLHGTRLAQELVGKSFAVTDDGFLKKIRAAQFSNDVTRVVLDVNDVTEYSAFLLPNPYRLIIDIHGGTPLQATGNREQGTGQQETGTADVPLPRTAAAGKTAPGRPVPNTVATKSATTATDVAALSDQPGKVEATSVPTSRPIAAVVPGAGSREEGVGSNGQAADVAAAPVAGSGSSLNVRKGKKGAAVVDPAAPARAAVPTADGETSLVRALGLKVGRIVIDAGHGGHDSGTLGVDGLEEKDVVLDVALRLGKILHDRLGAEIIYTRSDDTFIPLETRTAIANKSQADLFLSIHANSSSDASARGVETYYLNFTSQPDALEVAARENAVSDQSIHQLSDLVKKIALKEKIDESREFASDVETSLYGGLQKGNTGLKNRGVKKAPFVVLIGANMPSILAEISFVTNPRDAKQLRQPDYRQRVAESLYKGVAKYAGGLSGAKAPAERASNDR